MNNSHFEVCSSSIDDVVAAIEGGADRVELCRDLEKDGLTPDYETIKIAVRLSPCDTFRRFRRLSHVEMVQ